LVLAATLVTATALPASEADAVAISWNIQIRHSPYAGIIDPIFAAPDSDDTIVGYSRCGDSALWTGHYLAAESFRYAVTKSPDALAFVRKAVWGIQKLIDVTGTDVLARCAVPTGSPWAAGINSEEAHNGVHLGNFDNQPHYWIGNTSRDQYAGVYFGLAVAYDLVDDADTRAWVKWLVGRLTDHLLHDNWLVKIPNGGTSTTFIGRPDQQLSFLQVARRINPDRYNSKYQVLAFTRAFGVPAPILVELLDPRGSYFKFNLDEITLYNLLRMDNGSSYRDFYLKAYNSLRATVDDHQNGFFNMIDRALKGPDANRDAETVALLEAWLERPRRDIWVDLRGQYATCFSGDEACFVIPVEKRVNTDFLWQRSPFQLYGGGAGLIETAGIDYILPYWMARYYGVVTE
jgi:hypothetical protein